MESELDLVIREENRAADWRDEAERLQVLVAQHAVSLTELQILVDAAQSTVVRAEERWSAEHDERIKLEEQLECAEKNVATLQMHNRDLIVQNTAMQSRLQSAEMCLGMQRQTDAQAVGQYTFKSHIHTRPDEVEPDDAFAITLVAVAGHNKDWVCYAAQAGTLPHRVATNGDKTPKEHAGIFTYVMQLLDYGEY